MYIFCSYFSLIRGCPRVHKLCNKNFSENKFGGLSGGSSMLRPRPTWVSAEIIIIFHPFIFIVCTKDNYFVLTTLTKFGAFEGV
jgi:hypothetical protein